MGLVVFLILFFALVLYLLFVPIILRIDTDHHQYEIQLQGLARASIEEHKKELLRIKLRVLGFRFYFYPLRKKVRTLNLSKGKDHTLSTERSRGAKDDKKKKHKKDRRSLGIKKMIRLLRTFTIKKMVINLDTGDDVLNAKLYPIFGFLNYHIGTFNINFEGRNRLVLQMQNRPIYIIKSFINK